MEARANSLFWRCVFHSSGRILQVSRSGIEEPRKKRYTAARVIREEEPPQN
jgi:hypothetical protein